MTLYTISYNRAVMLHVLYKQHPHWIAHNPHETFSNEPLAQNNFKHAIISELKRDYGHLLFLKLRSLPIPCRIRESRITVFCVYRFENFCFNNQNNIRKKSCMYEGTYIFISFCRHRSIVGLIGSAVMKRVSSYSWYVSVD